MYLQVHAFYCKIILVFFSFFLLFQLDLVLKSDGGDLSDFTTNGEWYLLGKYYFIHYCYSVIKILPLIYYQNAIII